MSLSIGTLVGYLQLDDANFARKADAADRKMSALQLQLQALSKVDPKLKLDTAETTAKIDALKARIADLKEQASKGVDVRVEMVTALTELDLLQAKIREVARTVVIPVEVTGWAAAVAKLEAVNGAASKLGSKIPPMLTMISALGPAVLAAGGAATVGFGAMASGIASTAAGVGVLKLALGGLKQSIGAYQTYERAIAGNTTAKQDQAAYNTLSKSAYGKASPQLQAFSRFTATSFSKAFDVSGMRTTAQNNLLPGLEAGMKSIIPLAPIVQRGIGGIAASLGDMAKKGGAALNDPFWRRWFTWLGHTAAAELPVMGDAVGHLVEGIARAIKKFSPDGMSLLKWVDNLAKKFDHWTTTDGFTNFLATVHKDAAVVGKFFQDAGPVIGDFLKGVAQTGSGELSAFSGLFAAIGALPPGVIVALGQWFPIIALAIKGMQIADAVADGIKAMGVAMGILDAEMDANPIGLVIIAIAALAAGLIYAYNHSETFRDIVNGAFAAVSAAAQFMWNKVLKPTFKFLVSAFLAAAQGIVDGAALAFGWVPGIGPKLKAAAAKFNQFADDANNALAGIHNRDVTVTAHLTGTAALKSLMNPNPKPQSSVTLNGPNDWQGFYSAGTKPKQKALGGNLQRAVAYVVGEQGRELFLPGTNGRMITAAQLATAGHAATSRDLIDYDRLGDVIAKKINDRPVQLNGTLMVNRRQAGVIVQEGNIGLEKYE